MVGPMDADTVGEGVEFDIVKVSHTAPSIRCTSWQTICEPGQSSMFESARTNSGTAKRGRPDQAIEIFPSLCVDEQGGCFQLRPMKVEPAVAFATSGFQMVLLR